MSSAMSWSSSTTSLCIRRLFTCCASSRCSLSALDRWGQETALGQICADYLGVDFNNVHVVTGDSAAIPYGVGTFASRVMVTAGNAIAQASEQLRNKALELAAHKFERTHRAVRRSICFSGTLRLTGPEI